MIEEKTYFNFRLGKWRFVLKDNFLYKNRETGKVHMSKVFKINRENSLEFENWLSFYTGCQKPYFVYDTIEYEGNRHNLMISIGWGILHIYFPWRNKKVTEEDVNNPQPKYGFYLYGDGRLFDSIYYYVNKNGKSDTRCIEMPWYTEFYRHSIYLKDGSWWNMLESERKKARKNGISTWKDKRFYLSDDDDSILKKQFPFKYTTKNGEIQETTATCFMEEREWRPKWLRWTSLFNLIRTELSITFSDEMGNQRGSWKGGVIGVGAPITTEERDKVDFETPLRRYEEKVNKIHDYDK